MKTTKLSVGCSTKVFGPVRLIPGTKDEHCKPEYGMNYIPGNGIAYFSLTATTYQSLRENGGGCCHDTIRKSHPELAGLIPFHLWDQDGKPMHYVENALYWAELASGTGKWAYKTNVPSGYKTFFDVLSSHIGTKEIGDTNQLLVMVHQFGEMATIDFQSARESFKRWLLIRLESMQDVFLAAMAKHNVELIEVESAVAA